MHTEDDKPAAGFAYEHLEGLEDWLLECLAFVGVWRVAVGYALHVLCIVRESLRVDSNSRTWYLVSRVLHTPVRSIMATRTGIMALDAMVDGAWRMSIARRNSKSGSGSACQILKNKGRTRQPLYRDKE